jgi:hypothetical protein
MAGRAATPQGRKLGNINNMPNRRYLPSINFSVPYARWSHFYVSIDWTKDQETRHKINLKSTKPVQQIKLSKGFKQFIHDLTEFNEWIKCNKQTSSKSFQTIKFYCSYDFTAALKEIGEVENINKQKN